MLDLQDEGAVILQNNK